MRTRTTFASPSMRRTSRTPSLRTRDRPTAARIVSAWIVAREERAVWSRTPVAGAATGTGAMAGATGAAVTGLDAAGAGAAGAGAAGRAVPVPVTATLRIVAS